MNSALSGASPGPSSLASRRSSLRAHHHDSRRDTSSTDASGGTGRKERVASPDKMHRMALPGGLPPVLETEGSAGAGHWEALADGRPSWVSAETPQPGAEGAGTAPEAVSDPAVPAASHTRKLAAPARTLETAVSGEMLLEALQRLERTQSGAKTSEGTTVAMLPAGQGQGPKSGPRQAPAREPLRPNTTRLLNARGAAVGPSRTPPSPRATASRQGPDSRPSRRQSSHRGGAVPRASEPARPVADGPPAGAVSRERAGTTGTRTVGVAGTGSSPGVRSPLHRASSAPLPQHAAPTAAPAKAAPARPPETAANVRSPASPRATSPHAVPASGRASRTAPVTRAPRDRPAPALTAAERLLTVQDVVTAAQASPRYQGWDYDLAVRAMGAGPAWRGAYGDTPRGAGAAKGRSGSPAGRDATRTPRTEDSSSNAQASNSTPSASGGDSPGATSQLRVGGGRDAPSPASPRAPFHLTGLTPGRLESPPHAGARSREPTHASEVPAVASAASTAVSTPRALGASPRAMDSLEAAVRARQGFRAHAPPALSAAALAARVSDPVPPPESPGRSAAALRGPAAWVPEAAEPLWAPGATLRQVLDAEKKAAGARVASGSPGSPRLGQRRQASPRKAPAGADGRGWSEHGVERRGDGNGGLGRSQSVPHASSTLLELAGWGPEQTSQGAVVTPRRAPSRSEASLSVKSLSRGASTLSRLANASLGDLAGPRAIEANGNGNAEDVNNGAVEEGTVLRSPTASEAFDITFSDNDTHGTNDRGTVEAGESPAAVSAGKPKASGDSPPVASVRKPDAGVPLGPGREENPEVSSADGPPDFWRQLQGSGMGGVGRGDRMGLANGYGQDRGPLADGAGGRDAVGVRSGELWRAEGSRSVGEMPGVAGRSISEAEGGHGALHSALHKASSSVQETLTINGRGGGASVQGRPRAGSAGAAVSEGRMRVTGRGRVGSVASSSDGRGSAVGRVVAAGGGSGGVTRSRPSRRLASAPTDGVADGAALFQAAIAGDINKVKRLVRQGVNADWRDPEHRTTAVHCAAMGGSVAVLQFLVEVCRVPATTKAKDGANAMHMAAAGGSSEAVRYLHQNCHLDVNSKGPLGCTPLFFAQSEEVAEALLKAGAALGHLDEAGRTALHVAAAAGRSGALSALLRHASDREACARDVLTRRSVLHVAVEQGQSACVEAALASPRAAVLAALPFPSDAPPLHHAVLTSDTGLLDALLRAGADPRGTNRVGIDALHLALRHGKLGMASTLLSQCPSIDPNRLDPQGRCPLMLAAEKGSVDIMMQLVERGADPNGCPVHQGRLLYPTPLHVAAEAGQLEAAAFLIRAGAIVQSRDVHGRTPLHAAATCVQETGGAMIQLLVQCGASMRSQDHQRRTPFHAACLAGNLPAVSVMLEDIGIDVHVKDERGPTPLHLAVAEGHLAVAQYLVDNSDTSILAQDNEGATPLQVAEAEASRLAADRHAKALRVQSCVNFLRALFGEAPRPRVFVPPSRHLLQPGSATAPGQQDRAAHAAQARATPVRVHQPRHPSTPGSPLASAPATMLHSARSSGASTPLATRGPSNDGRTSLPGHSTQTPLEPTGSGTGVSSPHSPTAGDGGVVSPEPLVRSDSRGAEHCRAGSLGGHDVDAQQGRGRGGDSPGADRVVDLQGSSKRRSPALLRVDLADGRPASAPASPTAWDLSGAGKAEASGSSTQGLGSVSNWAAFAASGRSSPLGRGAALAWAGSAAVARAFASAPSAAATSTPSRGSSSAGHADAISPLVSPSVARTYSAFTVERAGVASPAGTGSRPGSRGASAHGSGGLTPSGFHCLACSCPPPPGKAPVRCSRCLKARYCSQDCLEADGRRHRAECRML